jgi:hypothetical protein
MSPPTERPTRQVLPRNRPPSRAAVDSALGHEETCAVQQNSPLFDDFVGDGEQRRRYFDAKEPGRLRVDD